MPRKKPRPEMPDRELYETLFPKKIRDRLEKEIELEVPETEEENEDDPTIGEDDT